MKVAVASRTAGQVEEAAAAIEAAGGKALVVHTDVIDQALVGKMVERVLEEFGRIDLLLNDAGSFNAIGPVWEVDPQDWWGGRDYKSIWQIPVRSCGLTAHDRAGEREDCEY